MIDIHSHVLPAIDDGSDSMDTSVQMLRQAEASGTTHVFCTPHVLDTGPVPSPDFIDECTAALRTAARAEGIAVELLPGSEVMLTLDLPERHGRGELRTLGNSHYLLIEPPLGGLPRYTEDVLFELALAGLFPILAHPERSVGFMACPARLLSLVEKGILVQANAGSFTGMFGPEVQRFAMGLAAAGQVHMLGSDAHSIRRRCMGLDRGFHAIERQLPAATSLVWDNPMAVVRGHDLQVPDPKPIAAGGSWLARLFGLR